ncbi:MAG: DNA cytosine methyltransferase [Nitrosotalea sp.]
MKTEYRIIDIFSGMGLASLGFKKAGFQIAAALEIDPLRCRIYEKNIGLKPIQSDVMKINGKQLLSKANLRKGSKFCMIGCPPCQSFSKLSDTRGIDALEDPRSKYVNKFAKIVKETKPTAVIFENVPWMIEGPGRIFFERYVKSLKKSGYETFSGTVNAANFGVPQNRLRVVAISIKKKLVTKKVKEEISKFYGTERKNPKTVRDAIGNLKPLRTGQGDKNDFLHLARTHTPKVLEMIKHIPKDGGSRRQLPRRLWLDCHKKIKHGADSVYGRMSWDKPSTTITGRCTTPACGRFLHPTQNRGITVREAARLQTIPKYFEMEGSRQDLEEMIGDAVPVLLAQKVAQKLLKILP